MNEKPLLSISSKKWLLKHANHRKTTGETPGELMFYPHGSSIPTRKKVGNMLFVKCEDCNEVLFYDGVTEEVQL